MTKDGRYYIRVSATVKIASLPELIDLIAKGRYRDRLLFKTQIPHLESSISASMCANANFEQALTSIAKLEQAALSTSDETIKIEIIEAVGRLSKNFCNNDQIIQNLLMILAHITSTSSVTSYYASHPSKKIFRMVIEILERVFSYVTLIAQDNNRTKNILHLFSYGWIGMRLGRLRRSL